MLHNQDALSQEYASAPHDIQTERGSEMATSIRLDDDFVSNVKVHADAASRSIPKQIEHWAKIGRIAEDNPDLPYSFISETLLSQSEIRNNKVTRYVRKTVRSGS